MADFNSSLPVRTQTNGDVVVFIADATTPSQLTAVDSHGSLSVLLKDSSGTAITSTTVNSLDRLNVYLSSEGVAGTANPFSTVQVGGSDGTDIRTLLTDNTGKLIVVANNFPATVDTNYGIVGASTLRSAAQIGNATGAADFNYGIVGAQTLRNASQIGNATGAADFNNGTTGAQTLRTAANLAIGGANVTTSNPVPVTVVSSVPGTNIQAYFTSASLAAGASTTFTYTVVAAHTFNLERVWSSASGKIKSLVQNNGSTIFVGFNSTANPNIDMTVAAPPLIAAGNTVTVTITNNDLLDFDVYATIEGNQN